MICFSQRPYCQRCTRLDLSALKEFVLFRNDDVSTNSLRNDDKSLIYQLLLYIYIYIYIWRIPWRILLILTSEGALTGDLVCLRITFGRRLYAPGRGWGTGKRERGTEFFRSRKRHVRHDDEACFRSHFGASTFSASAAWLLRSTRAQPRPQFPSAATAPQPASPRHDLAGPPLAGDGGATQREQLVVGPSFVGAVVVGGSCEEA